MTLIPSMSRPCASKTPKSERTTKRGKRLTTGTRSSTVNRGPLSMVGGARSLALRTGGSSKPDCARAVAPRPRPDSSSAIARKVVFRVSMKCPRSRRVAGPRPIAGTERGLSIRRCHPHHAAEPDVAGRRVDRLRIAGGRPVAPAIVGRAQVRSALEHLPGNPDIRLARIVALRLAPAARVVGNAARAERLGLVLGPVPVGGPFPHVADHVVDAVSVWREGVDRRRALIAVGEEILPRKLALPGVRHVPAPGRQLVAPCELDALEPAARGVLPFRLRG